MSSFIDMMADDVWSEADIVRRTETMIRSEFPAEIETILNRKVTAATLGEYELSEQEQTELARYKAVSQAAQTEGVGARADMALLLSVFPFEAAQRRLDRTALVVAWDRLQDPEVAPVLDEETGEIVNAAEVEQDKAERATAQAVVAPHLIEREDGQTILDPEAVEVDKAERDEAKAYLKTANTQQKTLIEQRKAR